MNPTIFRITKFTEHKIFPIFSVEHKFFPLPRTFQHGQMVSKRCLLLFFPPVVHLPPHHPAFGVARLKKKFFFLKIFGSLVFGCFGIGCRSRCFGNRHRSTNRMYYRGRALPYLLRLPNIYYRMPYPRGHFFKLWYPRRDFPSHPL